MGDHRDILCRLFLLAVRDLVFYCSGKMVENIFEWLMQRQMGGEYQPFGDIRELAVALEHGFEPELTVLVSLETELPEILCLYAPCRMRKQFRQQTVYLVELLLGE